jgi:hypothetical protein
LITRDGYLVTVIDLPDLDPSPNLIAWHRRVFVLIHDGSFREATIYRASDPPVQE